MIKLDPSGRVLLNPSGQISSTCGATDYCIAKYTSTISGTAWTTPTQVATYCEALTGCCGGDPVNTWIYDSSSAAHYWETANSCSGGTGGCSFTTPSLPGCSFSNPCAGCPSLVLTITGSTLVNQAGNTIDGTYNVTCNFGPLYPWSVELGTSPTVNSFFEGLCTSGNANCPTGPGYYFNAQAYYGSGSFGLSTCVLCPSTNACPQTAGYTLVPTSGPATVADWGTFIFT